MITQLSAKRALQIMQWLIDKQAEKTMRTHSNDFRLLIKTTDLIEDFFLTDGMYIDAHISKVTDGKYSHTSDLGLRFNRADELADQENTLVHIS